MSKFFLQITECSVDCGETNVCFQVWNSSSIVNYLANNFFENIDILNINFKNLTSSFELFNFVYK